MRNVSTQAALNDFASWPAKFTKELLNKMSFFLGFSPISFSAGFLSVNGSREKRSREKCCKGEMSSGRNFFQTFTTASYLLNITTCCKYRFTLIFTTSDNIYEDGVFIMSPLGVNVISYWLLQLVTIFKKMLSLVVKFTISKVAKFHKNSQIIFKCHHIL